MEFELNKEEVLDNQSPLKSDQDGGDQLPDNRNKNPGSGDSAEMASHQGRSNHSDENGRHSSGSSGMNSSVQPRRRISDGWQEAKSNDESADIFIRSFPVFRVPFYHSERGSRLDQIRVPRWRARISKLLCPLKIVAIGVENFSQK